MEDINNDKLYYNEYNLLTHNSFSINYIRDYDEIDVKIINSLKYYNNLNNLVDMLIDNINYNKLSNEDYKILLEDISNNKVSKIIDLILRQ